ncbi:MAG: hypothetical protein PGN07_02165 [Aeromicrobium erythreum]
MGSPLMRRLLVAASVLVLLAGCRGEPAPSPTPSASSSLATSIFGTTRDYCEVQGLRRMLAEGTLRTSQLPSWADRTVVDGTPRIIDFTTVPPEGHAARLDKLFASPGLRGIDVDEGYLQDCIRDTTNADVERTQGGPGYRARR